MAVPMDADSALLAIQLLNDDVAGIQSALKGKHRDDEPDPQEFPWQAFLTELETYEQIASDEKMSLSIATAIAKDRDIIAEEVRQQNQAAQDRNYAVSLCGDDPQDRASLRSATPSIAPTEDVDDEYLAKLFANYVSLEEATNILRPGTADSGAPGSAGGALNHGARNAPTRQCIACQEETSLFDVAKVPCGHEYCRECLDSLFSTAAKDENFFPPRCCRQRIHLHTARMFLTAKTATNFVKMEREFSTPDRTYCSRPACSSWIPPERIQAETATCPVCLETTCTICRNHGHEGDCPFDEALRDTERLASELGWQRCYQCRRFVELEFGCNHMVCKCNAEFCYMCGARWKTCRCRQWEEERLIARAERIHNRAPLLGAGQEDEQAAAQAIAGIANHLRENHNCDHARWRYMPGRHQCEECHFTLPQYIFECRQCRILACNRCRRNRL